MPVFTRTIEKSLAPALRQAGEQKTRHKLTLEKASVDLNQTSDNNGHNGTKQFCARMYTPVPNAEASEEGTAEWKPTLTSQTSVRKIDRSISRQSFIVGGNWGTTAILVSRLRSSIVAAVPNWADFLPCTRWLSCVQTWDVAPDTSTYHTGGQLLRSFWTPSTGDEGECLTPHHTQDPFASHYNIFIAPQQRDKDSCIQL